MWLRRHRITITLTTLVLLLLFIFLLPDTVVTIHPGEAGVIWERFNGGTVTVANDGKPFIGRIHTDSSGEATVVREHVERSEREISRGGHHVYPYGEGTHFKWPWDELFIYNIRLQQISHQLEVLSNDGLAMDAEVAITFKPVEADLGLLHRDVGPDYIKVLLVPTVAACARVEIAKYLPDALYSPQRLTIQEGIRQCTKKTMLSRFYPEEKRESYLMVEDVLIKNITLPAHVRQAIEEKVIQKHVAESYSYRLTRERLEADRKAIEAEGIRRFQATINSTISDGYLKWKGIDATLELAKSPNAKVVVIGAGKDGLPIILGGLDNIPGTTPRPMPATVPSNAAPAEPPHSGAPPAATPSGAAPPSAPQPPGQPARKEPR